MTEPFCYFLSIQLYPRSGKRQYASWKSKCFHPFHLHGTETELNGNELSKNSDKEPESHVRTSCALLATTAVPRPHTILRRFDCSSALTKGVAIFCPHTASFGPSLYISERACHMRECTGCMRAEECTQMQLSSSTQLRSFSDTLVRRLVLHHYLYLCHR